MIKNLAIISVVLIFAFGSFASCDEGKQGAGSYDIKKETIEVTATDFNLKDLAGKTHFLSDYRGKTVLLTFTTTWCPYCIKDIPNLKKIYNGYKDRDFELIAVYIQESDKKVASFVKKYDLPYTILLDTDGTVAQSYGVRGVPTKVLVDKKGKILCRACRTLEVMLEKELGSPK
jgi:peroxiredoxin